MGFRAGLENRLNKIVNTMESLLATDNNDSRQVRALLLGMKNAGKTSFRKAVYQDVGDERQREKFHDIEKRRNKSDGICRTCITLADRQSIDIAFKRFEEEEYDWESKNVKVHIVEPDGDIRQDDHILKFVQSTDAVAIFLDCSLPSGEALNGKKFLPFYEELDQFPPIVIVYNKKDTGVKGMNKMKAREHFRYDLMINKTPYMILELEVDNVTSEENRSAIANALIRQGTLRSALDMPIPNPRVVQDFSIIPKRGAELHTAA